MLFSDLSGRIDPTWAAIQRKTIHYLLKGPENPLASPRFHTFTVASAAQGHMAAVAVTAAAAAPLLPLMANEFPLNNEQHGAV